MRPRIPMNYHGVRTPTRPHQAGFILNLHKYKRSGRSRYDKLSKTVRNLLERAITADSGYRLQQIQCRAKSVESLHRRLEEIGQLDTDNVEDHRKDLAGCRIIFYTNNDVNRFAGSGLINDLFDVDWERSRIHQPEPTQHSLDRLFQSNNYVVKLKSDRTAFLRCRRFDGLYCEVQVQTSLNHVWAEMEHDTIYKRPDLEGFGARQLKVIESRLEDAMRNHLLPAGYLFQRIATDVERLVEGKELFDSSILDSALAAENNNDRHDALEQLKDYVLPNYNDLPGVFPELQDKLEQIWVAAGATETVPYEIPFGNYQGRELHEVTSQIIGIMKACRYVDPDRTYAFTRDLFIQTSDLELQSQLVELAESLARPTLQIWERYGPMVQVRLADALSKETDIASIAPIATAIASAILRPDITGTTWSSNALTYSRGVVTHSPALEEARRTVVDVVSGYAQSVVGDDNALQGATNSLFESGRWPDSGTIQPEVAIMTLSDLAHAVERMTQIAPQASLNARQDVECLLFQHWRWNRSLPEHLASQPKVVEAHERLIANMISLREVLNADEEFVVFKTIVGYKSIFPHQWEHEDGDFSRDEAMRNQQQDELVDSITAESWPIWKLRLATAARVKSKDSATFPPYERFLSAIADRQPTLAFELLADRSALPDWTIQPITRALVKGGLRGKVEGLLVQWVDDGRFLREIAQSVTSRADDLAALVSKVASRAVDDGDENACITLVVKSIERYAENPQFWLSVIFFPCLVVLRSAGSHGWIARSWDQSGQDSLFANLTAEQSEVVLAAMVGVDRIDEAAEEILKSIALTDHQLVLGWFGQRVEIGLQEPLFEFESIPYSFQCLHEVLQPYPWDVLTSIRDWYDRDDLTSGMDTAYFLSKIYSKLEEPLPGVLLEFVRHANGEDLLFLACSLRGFKGQPKLLPILRAIIASEATSEEIEDYVSQVFWESGVIMGEFGATYTYQEKAELLKPWLEDESARVVSFAAREKHNLENMVATENRRAQEEIAMRKLQYGESFEGDDASGSKDNTSCEGSV